jgi:hypothetical protein
MEPHKKREAKFDRMVQLDAADCFPFSLPPPLFSYVHPACPMECHFHFYSIGVKLRSKGSKTNLFHWGASLLLYFLTNHTHKRKLATT